MTKQGPYLVDLHCHPLPGVDDGPRTFEESLAMLRRAHGDGIRRLVATPHMFSPSFPEVDALVASDAYAALVSRLEKEAERPENHFLRELEIVLGAECFVGLELFEALEAGCALSLNNSRYLLVELSPYFGPSGSEAALARVMDHGYVPVVAHVERVLAPQGATEVASRWVERGALLQINAQSLLEGFFSPRRGICHALLEQGLVHVVASDGHDVEGRPPLLSPAYKALERSFGAEAARLLTMDLAARILDNQPVPWG